MPNLNNDHRFKINRNVDLDRLGRLANEALFAFGEDPDACRDHLFEIHGMIFPNASRMATAAENAAIVAGQEV
jgi:phosphoglucomutase